MYTYIYTLYIPRYRPILFSSTPRTHKYHIRNNKKKMVMSKLKIGGSWSGVLEVELEEWTVKMLREEVAKRSGCEPNLINLICAGKVLKDGDVTEKLSQLGVKNNAKILSSRVSHDHGKSLKDEFLAEEERAKRLSRLKSAVSSLVERHADGSIPLEDYNMELNNQSGQKVNMGTETDQKAIMMGLMLHTNAKGLIKKGKYKEALEVLIMGEEAFSLCDQKLIEMVDNVSILQIDIVWCYFMLRDITCLSVAGLRLVKAREGIERSHGKEGSRVRLLQGDRYPEIALHLRLELLEGVAAFHSGELEKSKQALSSAQAKFAKLQVSDENLSLVMSMGFNGRQAKRALRMSNQNIENAIDFLVVEKEKKEKQRKEDIQHQRNIMEQKRYGMTPLRKAVDIEKLNELVSIGFERELAAEALRKNENDIQIALDDLTNQETNATIQVVIESRKKRRLSWAAEVAKAELISLGFPSEMVTTAVDMFGSKEAALPHLISLQNGDVSGISGGASDSNVVSGLDGENDEELGSGSGLGLDGENDEELGSGSGSGENGEWKERDVEMEEALTNELLEGDVYADYDIEVTIEGEAINEYMAMVNSGSTSN